MSDGTTTGGGTEYFSATMAAALAAVGQARATLFGLCPRCPAAMWVQHAKDAEELGSPYFKVSAKCRVLGHDPIAQYAVDTATLTRLLPLEPVVTACDMHAGELALWREAQEERPAGDQP